MTTLQQFQAMERAATPAVFAQLAIPAGALPRVLRRVCPPPKPVYETQLEQQALNRLAAASEVGSALAMQEAENESGPGRRAAGRFRPAGPRV